MAGTLAAVFVLQMTLVQTIEVGMPLLKNRMNVAKEEAALRQRLADKGLPSDGPVRLSLSPPPPFSPPSPPSTPPVPCRGIPSCPTRALVRSHTDASACARARAAYIAMVGAGGSRLSQ